MTVRRELVPFLIIPFVVAAVVLSARVQSAASLPAGQTTAQVAQPVSGQTSGQLGSTQHSALALVVLDPAHGGTDQGARGSTGITESDAVLGIARLVRISLEGQGLRALLTRQANEGPSFDERSKIANSQRGAIFISLHVSSTGQPGTVRVYSLAPDTAPSAQHGGLISWDHAQSGSQDLSRKLAELLQIQMAQRFHSSPETPLTARVRQLRTIAIPAVAIEISSVSLPDRGPLDQMSPAFADAVARAVAAFRLVYESGGQ